MRLYYPLFLLACVLSCEGCSMNIFISWLMSHTDRTLGAVLLHLRAHSVHNASQTTDLATWAGLVYHSHGGWVVTTAHEFAGYIHAAHCTEDKLGCDLEGMTFSLTVAFNDDPRPGPDAVVNSKQVTVASREGGPIEQTVFFHPQVLASIEQFYRGGKHLQGDVVLNLRNHLIANSNDLVLIGTKTNAMTEDLVLIAPTFLQTDNCYALSTAKDATASTLWWEYNLVVNHGDAHCPRGALRNDSMCATVERDRELCGEDVVVGPLVCLTPCGGSMALGMAKGCEARAPGRDAVEFVAVKTEERWILGVVEGEGYVTLRNIQRLQVMVAVGHITIFMISVFEENYKCLFSFNLVHI